MSQPWKAPYRPSNQVTQSYNDGVVTIYSVEDAARPGYQPEPKLTKRFPFATKSSVWESNVTIVAGKTRWTLSG